jgi:hypothetical protein
MTAGPLLFAEEASADVVAASFGPGTAPRLRETLSALVRHLHAFVKEVELTEDEWGAALDCLTRTGQRCDPLRQEFILLSDVLGISMLVETLNHRTAGRATESTVLGPFHQRHRARGLRPGGRIAASDPLTGAPPLPGRARDARGLIPPVVEAVLARPYPVIRPTSRAYLRNLLRRHGQASHPPAARPHPTAIRSRR